MKVYIDGKVVAPEEAHVSVLDHGLLYGDGVFEGIRIRGGRIFRLEDHLHRLDAGCAAIGIQLPGGREGARRACLESARALDADEAYLRLVVTRGEGALGIDPTLCKTPRLFCIAGTIQLYSDEERQRGIAMVTSYWRRPSPDVLDPRVKSLNYLNNVLAKRDAKMRGAAEALVLNGAGRVAEAAAANVFAWRRGELLTPPPSEGALEGITRTTVLSLARDLGIETKEIPLTRADLLDAEEVFLTGSGAGITRVGTLDDVPIGRGYDAPTSVSEKLFGALIEFARNNGVPFRVD